MNYIALSTKTRTSPEFIGSEPVHRATWLCLTLYCAEHETGGIIRDCGSWGDRRWMQTVGVTKAEVRMACALYEFKESSKDTFDLHVWGYDAKYEAAIRAKRGGGKVGGTLSGVSRSNDVIPCETKDTLKESLKDTLQESLNGVNGIGVNRIKSVRFAPGADKYEVIRSLPHSDLAAWAVAFCGDEAAWTRVYKTFIDKLGPEGFRAILESFVAEVEAGEDGRVRGSVLVKKLKVALAEKRGGVISEPAPANPSHHDGAATAPSVDGVVLHHDSK